MFPLYKLRVVPYDCNDLNNTALISMLWTVTVGRRLCRQRNKRHRGGLMAAQRMTQTQLVRSLAENCEVPNKTARSFVEQLASMAIQEVKKNGVFVIPGLGRLVRQERKARMGRNPATGESIKIPAKKVVKFRVAKAAKDAIVPPKKPKATAS
jgi:DNA-binding protein HU-beta